MTDAGGTMGVPTPFQRRALGRSANAVRSSPPIVRRVNPLPALLALVGVILPTELQISVAGAKFTPGRIGVVLLLFPALFMLSQKGRRILFCDLLACATAGWIVVATVSTVGLSALFAAAGGENS